MLHEFPDHLPVHTVKRFLKVHEHCVHGGLPLQGLFDDDSQCGNLISAGSVLAEPGLFVPKRLVKLLLDISRIILVKIFPGTDSNMMPLQLLQEDMSPFWSPFFGSFTRCPFFHSSGTSSVSQIFISRRWSISVDVCTSAFSASGGTPS